MSQYEEPPETNVTHTHEFEPTGASVRVTARCKACGQITTEVIEERPDTIADHTLAEAERRFKRREQFP